MRNARVHPALAVCSVMAVICLTAWLKHSGELAGGHAHLQDFKLDPNRASKSDLSLLPGIGALRATEIVAYRERRGMRSAVDPACRVFHNAGDLAGVSGIGPITVQKVAPFLVFPSGAESSPSVDASP